MVTWPWTNIEVQTLTDILFLICVARNDGTLGLLCCGSGEICYQAYLLHGRPRLMWLCVVIAMTPYRPSGFFSSSTLICCGSLALLGRIAVDASCCYRPSSVDCRSVCHTSELCQNGWTDQDAVKNSSVTTKRLYLILTFRSYHEIFIRRSWYSVLPSLDATISCRIKKAVIGVTQLITALVSIHSSMTFLADMYSFLDPPVRMVLFFVDDCSLFPVDCMIGLICMVGECWLAIFCETGCVLTSVISSFGLGLNFRFMFI